MPAAVTQWIPDGAQVFIAAGWTVEQWTDLHQFFTNSDATGAPQVARWLRNPYRDVHPCAPGVFVCTRVVIMDFFARHGEHAAQLLTAFSAGASERFTIAFLGYDPFMWDSASHSPARTGWQYATRDLGLSEPDATGWAGTGYLHPPPASTWCPAGQWVTQVGPGAWLWVLAGFTLDEVVELQQARPTITEQQLRVMAVLNGHTLPAGI